MEFLKKKTLSWWRSGGLFFTLIWQLYHYVPCPHLFELQVKYRGTLLCFCHSSINHTLPNFFPQPNSLIFKDKKLNIGKAIRKQPSSYPKTPVGEFSSHAFGLEFFESRAIGFDLMMTCCGDVTLLITNPYLVLLLGWKKVLFRCWPINMYNSILNMSCEHKRFCLMHVQGWDVWEIFPHLVPNNVTFTCFCILNYFGLSICTVRNTSVVDTHHIVVNWAFVWPVLRWDGYYDAEIYDHSPVLKSDMQMVDTTRHASIYLGIASMYIHCTVKLLHF